MATTMAAQTYCSSRATADVADISHNFLVHFSSSQFGCLFNFSWARAQAGRVGSSQALAELWANQFLTESSQAEFGWTPLTGTKHPVDNPIVQYKQKQLVFSVWSTQSRRPITNFSSLTSWSRLIFTIQVPTKTCSKSQDSILQEGRHKK